MKRKKVLKLFTDFFKFGCFTFGGGWSILAQMKKTYVNKEHSLTEEELLDITTVGRSLPGIVIGNTAMLYGYKEAGLIGGLASIFGVCIPPTLIIVGITYIYTAFRDNMWISCIMEGIRASVVPIVIYSVYGMLKSAFRFPPCYFVFIATFVLFYFYNVSCIYLIIFGMIFGIVISEIYERKETKNV